MADGNEVQVWEGDQGIPEVCPKSLTDALIKAQNERPELFGLDEWELKKKLGAEKSLPSETDDALRMRFWTAYEIAVSSGKRMTVSQIVAGVCSQSYITGVYLRRPEKLAWLTCPPSDLDVFRKSTLYYGTKKLRDILEVDAVIRDENGKPIGLNTKVAELQHKIIQMLELRVEGAVAQQIVQKNLNLNVSATDKQVQGMIQADTMEDIERRLAELRKKDRKALEVKTEGE